LRISCTLRYHHDGDRFLQAFAQALRHAQPLRPHGNIEEDEIGRQFSAIPRQVSPSNAIDRSKPSGRECHAEAAHARIVVDDENLAGVCPEATDARPFEKAARRPRWRRQMNATRKTLPFPTSLSTVSSPPMSQVKSCAMVSPRPVRE